MNALLTHTHTPTHILDLKPIPAKSYQLAKATFLPEASESAFGNRDSLDRDYNTADCQNKSSLYTTKNCTYPRAVVHSSKCPFAPGYYKECACLPQFKISSCPSPKILSSPTCNGKAASCVCPSSVSLIYANDRCTQYCDGSCIAKSCSPTPSETGCQYGTTSATNNCGGSRTVCKHCDLTPCSGISSKPENSYYTTKSCTDCSGTKTINTGWSCNSGYHQSGSSCIKDCTLPACSGISSKPSNSSYTTASCTDCSGTKTINTGWKCNSGYYKDGNYCTANCNIYYSDGTSASGPLISGKKAVGIVVSNLTVSIYDFTSTHAQAKNTSYYNRDGISNWKMPTMAQMKTIQSNKAEINRCMALISGTQLSETWYWTRDIKPNDIYIDELHMKTRATNLNNASAYNRVRLIK